MTDVSPSRTITIAGKDYVLDGSFATLRAVQQHFKKDVVQVLASIMDMRLDEIADLIAIAKRDTTTTADEIGQQIMDQVGVMKRDYVSFKLQLLAWLNIAIAPKAEREKKSVEMSALIARQNSPGPTTSDSPLDPSDGSPASSGAPTSGS